MPDFLLELRSEEIPARMQKGARAELEKLFRAQMAAAGITLGELTVWSTPRRLALIVRDIPDATEAVSEEAKGPPVGAPDQAVDGFCRKNGVTRDDLEVREVKGRETFFAVRNVPGRATKDVLAEAIPAIIRDFSWPKSMRWGAASLSTESLRWVRPLSGIVALLGDDVVECEVHGVTSGAVTLGHRFHHSGDVTIGNADDYAVKLRSAHAIVDHEERQDIIRTGARKAAEDVGLTLVEDEGLVVENAGLTEWPVPLLGRFEEDYLEVPPEVIQLTARVNQKYFVCQSSPERGVEPPQAVEGAPSNLSAGADSPPPRSGEDQLANAFICTANIEAEDGGARVVDGNRKVLAARLSDARFFWDVDRKKTLAQHAEGLERITFHEKLGTVADKVERVAKLARWLCEEGIVGGDPDLAEQAARLCKADLVTEMVGEFPELQGLMGGYYARAEGLPDEVSNAIRDHYKPVGQGDEVPTAPVAVAVSLADKLETIIAFFTVEEKPTGSKDPFALRRAAIGVLSTLASNGIRIKLQEFISKVATYAAEQVREKFDSALEKADVFVDLEECCPDLFTYRLNLIDGEWDTRPRDYAQGALDAVKATNLNFDDLAHAGRVGNEVADFFADRLKVQQREAGVRHDLIDAVFALGGEDDLVRLLARVKALQSFIDTEDGTNLLAGYKRAANILKKEEWEPGADNAAPELAEAALVAALDEAEPRAAGAIEAEDFAGAMAALASLRAPIDTFFEEVTVNADDAQVRAARLDLLARFRDAVHKVADFSKIEG